MLSSFHIFIFSFFILFVFASCAKTKIVPDEKLALIFRDIYLTNAYNQQHRTPNLDSLNIYEPVFAKYGYTSNDVQATIGNFSKRKSARLSDVVDEAIELLDEENSFYQWRIAIHDTIGLVARKRYSTVVYADSLIEVRRAADTSRLLITIPVEKVGTYEVNYSYLVDSTDTNSLRVNHYLLDGRNRQYANNSRRLRRMDSENVSVKFEAGENHRKLVLDLNGYPDEIKVKPHITINDLTVKYYLPDRVARDSMARSWFDYRAVDTLLYPSRGYPAADSLGYIVLP